MRHLLMPSHARGGSVISCPELDASVVWHPYDRPYPEMLCPTIVRAKDALLFLEDGASIIDGISSWWVNIHGHCHPHIVQSITNQSQILDHAIFAGFTHEPAANLAKRVLQLAPGKHSKVFFSDNGSTAVEVAIKMSIQYWQLRKERRQTIVHFEGAYHGDTFGAMSVAHRSVFSKPFHTLLFDAVALPLPDEGNIEFVIAQLRTLLKTGEIAAFIFEPLVQAAGGFRFYKSQYLDLLLQCCKEYGVITIADEVMTGFGRTGDLFASSALVNAPDMLCLAKGLTGGFLPLALTICNERVVDAFRSANENAMFFHGHSYTANPIACAAANASLDLVTSRYCQDQRDRIEGLIQDQTRRFLGRPQLRDVRSCWTIFAADFINVEPHGYQNTIKHRLSAFFLKRDVLVRPLGNVFYILPPYCITDEQLRHVFDVLEEYINAES